MENHHFCKDKSSDISDFQRRIFHCSRWTPEGQRGCEVYQLWWIHHGATDSPPWLWSLVMYTMIGFTVVDQGFRCDMTLHHLTNRKTVVMTCYDSDPWLRCCGCWRYSSGLVATGWFGHGITIDDLTAGRFWSNVHLDIATIRYQRVNTQLNLNGTKQMYRRSKVVCAVRTPDEELPVKLHQFWIEYSLGL